MNGAFRGRVIEQILAALYSGNGAGVDNGAAFAKMGRRGPCHVEIAVDIGLERAVQLSSEMSSSESACS